MHRAIPVGSKLLNRKWEEKEREIHIRKLKEIKAQVAIREPTKFKHLKKKLKRTQMLEGNGTPAENIDRYTEIERENRILLEKMTNIMQTRGSS